MEVISGGGRVKVKRSMDPVVVMCFGRAADVGFQAIPQLAMQIYLILKMLSQNDTVSTLQYTTVSSSIFAIGFIGANFDFDMDTSSMLRRVERKFYGWIPSNKKNVSDDVSTPHSL